MTNLVSNDLTQRPPRSPRVRIGGYVILARMLDKCRAVLAGKSGEYKFDCPLDQHFLDFVGIRGAQIKEVLAKGAGDGEVLSWITANATIKRTPSEIWSWSNYHEQRAPGGFESAQFFAEALQKCAPDREDISTWFDLLDLDDYLSFGGKV